MNPHSIEHQETVANGSFHMQMQDHRLAEMTYSRTNAALVIIDHTEVNASLGGQGVGRQMLKALVQRAHAASTKVVAFCRFTRHQFDRNASIRDVLA